MAYIETWWRCPGCNGAYSSYKEAGECAKKHVFTERWAISEKYPGKAVKVTGWRNEAEALRQAEESDNIEPKTKKAMNNQQIRLIKGGS